MSKRYWFAVVGNFTGCLLAFAAIVVLAYGDTHPATRILMGIVLFSFGDVTLRFQRIMDTELHRGPPTPPRPATSA